MIRHLLTTVLKTEFLSDTLLSSVMIKPSTAMALKLTIKHLAHRLLNMLFSLQSNISFICFFIAVVTHTPDYKKTPPPVPPRSITKPLISVTAQSSTESTQDVYHEGRPSRVGIWATDSLGRVIYNSSDSLDSAKAVTLAMETASKRLASAGSYSSVQTCDKAILVSKAEEYLKTPRSSIGIQVNLPQSFRFVSL